MSFFNRAWTTFSKIAIIIAIGVAFLFGMTGTVYLSLRSPEVTVPDVIGKDRQAAEDELSRAGLNIRVRATRYSADAKPDTILLQLPRSGEVVKTGQTVAVDVSRATAKEGESSTSVASSEEKKKEEEKKEDENKNSSNSSANNQNENANKRPRNKNANNANNSNNSNNRNANNRNSNNANANRTAPVVNRNTANVSGNGNRPGNTTNANKGAPTIAPNPAVNKRP